MNRKITRSEFIKNGLLGVLGFAVLFFQEKARAIGPFGFWKKKASGGFAATISSNQKELNLRTWALANGWNGTAAATITVASGVYIWSDNTGVAALTIDGSWPGGITLVNNGYIIGRGGNSNGNSAGSSGGNAISLSLNVTINCQSGYIGGGGGGGGTVSYSGTTYASGGGGAGGGSSASGFDVAGASGGVCGAVGANGNPIPKQATLSGSGGGGGRIIPGTGGAGLTCDGITPNSEQAIGGSGGGSGGAGGVYVFKSTGTGGSGGSGGSVGTVGSVVSGGLITAGGGGGGWGALGGAGLDAGFGGSAYGGGAGGKAVALSGYAVTWVGGFPAGRVFGAVS